MPDINSSFFEEPRRIQPIIYVINTSAGMTGGPITAINLGMKDALDELKYIQSNDPNQIYSIGVLQFNYTACWETDSLTCVEDFCWSDLYASGLPRFSEALFSLDSRLARRDLFSATQDYYNTPIIIFITKGTPTDNYMDALNALQNANRWFQVSSKIVICYRDTDGQMINAIASHEKCVLRVDTLEDLSKAITKAAILVLKGRIG